mmetsp:Transcript_24080/g.69214  ORF Transcript_24080/g.69214 Transcript_24080/m.69214 type:complete len:204 (+) Transcript_24080:237-848(+)
MLNFRKTLSNWVDREGYEGGNDLREDALITLGLYHVLGLVLTLEHLANLVGYNNLTSKAFRTLPLDLRKEGILTYRFNGTGKSRIKIAALTPQGWQVARSLGVPSERPATNGGAQEWIRRLLTTNNEIAMFNLLLEGNGSQSGIPRSTLCSMMGYSRPDSKGFRNPLSSLQKLGLIRQETEGGIKTVVLTDISSPHGHSDGSI